MTIVLSPLHQRMLALSLAGVALLLIWIMVVAPVRASIALHEEQVSMLRRQVLKLEALADAAPEYEKLARSASSNAEVRALTFAAAQSSVGVADLQTTLNQIFAAAGATVSTSQALPEVAGEGPVKIAVAATLELDIAALVRTLHAIGAAKPLLTVEKLSAKEPDGEWVNPTRVNAPNRLIVDLVVSARMRSN
jgi:Type II secretion system (T2SS), protein M subtype b